jgi:hypothetical protein
MLNSFKAFLDVMVIYLITMILSNLGKSGSEILFDYQSIGLIIIALSYFWQLETNLHTDNRLKIKPVIVSVILGWIGIVIVNQLSRYIGDGLNVSYGVVIGLTVAVAMIRIAVWGIEKYHTKRK